MGRQRNPVHRQKMLIPVSQRYHTAVKYLFYRRVCMPELYNANSASEMQLMKKKEAIQMKNYAFDGKEPSTS